MLGLNDYLKMMELKKHYELAIDRLSKTNSDDGPRRIYITKFQPTPGTGISDVVWNSEVDDFDLNMVLTQTALDHMRMRLMEINDHLEEADRILGGRQFY